MTVIWSGVNPALVISFRDLPAWECFPATAVSGGEFHHPHSCTALGISWSFPPKLEKMVFMAFMWQSSISEFILCLNKWNWLMFFFFSYFLSTLPNIYRPRMIFINKLLRKYGTNCFGSFILSGELNGDVKGAACHNKCVLQMACQEKDTESLKSLQTELWWASRGIHVHLKSWHCSSTFSIACLSKIFALISYLSSLQAFSDCWAESPSPPGGTRAHYTVGTRHLVQFSCNSLPVGNCSFYDGTFLLLTRSVVRPSEVLFSKCMCCARSKILPKLSLNQCIIFCMSIRMYDVVFCDYEVVFFVFLVISRWILM